MVETFLANSKFVWIIRHGQATHNPRAELAREKGCSMEEFLRLMSEDDSLDSELTELGRQQARAIHETIEAPTANHNEKDVAETNSNQSIELVISSPLSRAIETADIAIPHVSNRLVLEEFRECHGKLLNTKRRTRTELERKFEGKHWNWDRLVNHDDTLWTTEFESRADCSQRGYEGFCRIMDRPESRICLVSHGYILEMSMKHHPSIEMNLMDTFNDEDKRKATSEHEEEEKGPYDRFMNCELRKYVVDWKGEGDSHDPKKPHSTIIFTEIDRIRI